MVYFHYTFSELIQRGKEIFKFLYKWLTKYCIIVDYEYTNKSILK